MMKEAITWQKQKQVPVIYSYFIPFLTTNLSFSLTRSMAFMDIINKYILEIKMSAFTL
jgi:hypothetical protein